MHVNIALTVISIDCGASVIAAEINDLADSRWH